MSSHVVICRSEPVLPLLTFVQKSGNTTFYEWRTGKVPTVVERPVVEDAPPDTLTEDTVSFTVTILSSDDGYITNMQFLKCGLIQINMVTKQTSAPGLMLQLSAIVAYSTNPSIYLTTDFVFLCCALKLLD